MSLESIRPLEQCPDPAGFPLSASFRLSDVHGYIVFFYFREHNGQIQPKKCDISTNSQKLEKSVQNKDQLY